jgi:hypothetical protein
MRQSQQGSRPTRPSRTSAHHPAALSRAASPPTALRARPICIPQPPGIAFPRLATSRVAGGQVAGLAAFRGGEPGVAVAAQHRPGPGGVEFPEGARPGFGQRPAEFPVSGQGRVLAVPPPGVELQDGAPRVAGRAQQPESPFPLVAGEAQPGPGRSVHDPRRIRITFSRHETITARHTDKTTDVMPASPRGMPRARTLAATRARTLVNLTQASARPACTGRP